MLDDQIPVEELRALYVRGNLPQRYSVAAARIANPEHGPNQVVAAVAALEGFSRAVAVRAAVTRGTTLEGAYADLRRARPLDLILNHVLPALNVTPATAFDAEKWALVPKAIEFRNLLVHEATYLHGGTCRDLVEATVHVFERIAELAGAKPRTAA
jgi:hypothetical protein